MNGDSPVKGLSPGEETIMKKEDTRLENFIELVKTHANSEGIHMMYYAKHPESEAAAAWASMNLMDDEQSLLVGFCSICRVVRDTLMGNFEKSEADTIEDMVNAMDTAFSAPAEIFGKVE